MVLKGENDRMPDSDSRLPNHVAFIMDGNGRWAEARGMPRALGHQAGAETVRRVTEFCRRRGIAFLTLYAFSTENWSRPKDEVEALMALLESYLAKELPTLQENGIRLRIIGDASALSESLRRQLRDAESATAGNSAMTLTIAINYGGRDEIVRACRELAARCRDGVLSPDAISEGSLAAALDTAGTPDPDLLIRTAGEIRVSNFLIWQAAYAELYFTERCWPDFDDDDFEAALANYAARVRKFGAVP